MQIVVSAELLLSICFVNVIEHHFSGEKVIQHQVETNGKNTLVSWPLKMIEYFASWVLINGCHHYVVDWLADFSSYKISYVSLFLSPLFFNASLLKSVSFVKSCSWPPSQDSLTLKNIKNCCLVCEIVQYKDL